MLSHQKVNRYPGIQVISRKTNLALGLARLAAIFPEEFGFTPRTWALPNDLLEFRLHFSRSAVGSLKTYVVKPEEMSNARGVFLSQNLEHILSIALGQQANPYLDVKDEEDQEEEES